MKKFEKTVIVTDLDGTFLDEHEGLVKRNLDAIEYFKSHGGHFTIATGRVAEHAKGAVSGVETMVNLPAITCNGACLYDFRSGEPKKEYIFEYELIMEIVEFVRKNYPSVGIRASAADYCFVSTQEDIKNPLLASDFERYRGTSNLIAPYGEWKGLSIYKIVLRIDESLIDGAMDALKAYFGERVSVTQSWATIIDIQLGGVNKGATMESYVREALGKGVTIYACGDHINDVEMLTCADVAVCPSNAHPRVKEICDLCLCTNSEGLIAELIELIDREK